MNIRKTTAELVNVKYFIKNVIGNEEVNHATAPNIKTTADPSVPSVDIAFYSPQLF